MEYMPRGSLEKWLYLHNYFLDILQRLNVMIDVSNVLLDMELVGHVSDFGISKILGEGENMAITKTLATIALLTSHGF